MPEHVHLLVTEPERGSLSLALQMLKQNVSRKLNKNPRPVSPKTGETRTGHPLTTQSHDKKPRRPFWEQRYYDFNVWSEEKKKEKLGYVHRNPVKRELVSAPEDWETSSFRHYVSGAESAVEIESQWTARKREAKAS